MSIIGLRSQFRTDYTELTRLVSGRQIVRIYVCETLLHFRIGFSVIIDVFYSDVRVARRLNCCRASLPRSAALPLPRRPRLSSLPVVRQILRSPGTRIRMLSQSAAAAAADLLR